MSRAILNIHPEDKTWLMSQAKAEHISMAELIRRAINQYRNNLKTSSTPSFETLLLQTRGVWKHGDGLQYQEKIRQEWEKRE